MSLLIAGGGTRWPLKVPFQPRLFHDSVVILRVLSICFCSAAVWEVAVVLPGDPKVTRYCHGIQQRPQRLSVTNLSANGEHYPPSGLIPWKHWGAPSSRSHFQCGLTCFSNMPLLNQGGRGLSQ